MAPQEPRLDPRHDSDEPTIQIITPQKSECTLWSLVQYECGLNPSKIVCRPVYRILKKRDTE
ncbi:hypothetical protein EDD11_002685 [Mortierella claussenii]|nr:hypothetical protein EDD11_002685 [Mortierella claussenii]